MRLVFVGIEHWATVVCSYLRLWNELQDLAADAIFHCLLTSPIDLALRSIPPKLDVDCLRNGVDPSPVDLLAHHNSDFDKSLATSALNTFNLASDSNR